MKEIMREIDSARADFLQNYRNSKGKADELYWKGCYEVADKIYQSLEDRVARHEKLRPLSLNEIFNGKGYSKIKKFCPYCGEKKEK